MDLLFTLATAPGLVGVQKNLVANWIGPALFIIIAFVSVKFIMQRQFRELAGFLVIAAIVAILVFNATGLFGPDGVFYKIGDSFARLLG